MEWIKASSPPTDESPVLCRYTFHKDDGVMYFKQVLTYFAYDPNPHWQHESTGLIVTHWMPLPEDPKE